MSALPGSHYTSVIRFELSFRTPMYITQSVLRWNQSTGHKRAWQDVETNSDSALPKEEGGVIGEYKAMQEENFLSSWPRKMGERKKKGRRKLVS